MRFHVFQRGDRIDTTGAALVAVRSVADRHRYAIDPDRELVAFGAANVAAGLLSSFAVGSSQTRTLLNDATGGRTQMVSLIAAALTTTFVFLFISWIATIPSVAIAAILVFTGVTLIDVHVYSRLWRGSTSPDLGRMYDGKRPGW